MRHAQQRGSPQSLSLCPYRSRQADPTATGACTTQPLRLAHLLHSLVRVSRRDARQRLHASHLGAGETDTERRQPHTSRPPQDGPHSSEIAGHHRPPGQTLWPAPAFAPGEWTPTERTHSSIASTPPATKYTLRNDQKAVPVTWPPRKQTSTA